MSVDPLHGLEVRDLEETNRNYGSDPRARPITELLSYGLIVVDKPAGPTSHEVVAWVRRLLKVEKAGHSGTLDPPVTGLLPIGLGEATKVLSVLLLGPKEYYAVARLHDPVDERQLKGVLDEFTGEIFQRPPQRSSVKRVTRTRSIYELELMEAAGRLLLLRVLCQAGTYVRKLVYDIGEVLGPGATMVELRRTRVSHLDDTGLVKLHDLVEAYQVWQESGREEKLRALVRPAEDMVVDLKAVVIRDSAVDAVCHGAQLAVPGILRLSRGIGKGELVGVYSLKGELVALVEATLSTAEVLGSSKGIAFVTKRVVMKPGTYPRLWRAKKEVQAA